MKKKQIKITIETDEDDARIESFFKAFLVDNFRFSSVDDAKVEIQDLEEGE